MIVRRFFQLLILMGIASAAPSASDESVSFTFYHFPPKMRVEGDQMSGDRSDEMNRIAHEAGFAVDWIKTTLRQEAEMLDTGRREFCATGRAVTYERADRWVFLPYVQDELPPVIFVTRLGVSGVIRAHATSEDVLHDHSLRGALLQNFIYGTDIDRFLQGKPDWIIQPASDIF